MWWKITLKSRASEYIYWISDALDKKDSEIKTAYQFYTPWAASTSFPIGRVQPSRVLKFHFSKQYILIGLFTFITATSQTLRCALCSSFDLFSAAAPLELLPPCLGFEQLLFKEQLLNQRLPFSHCLEHISVLGAEMANMAIKWKWQQLIWLFPSLQSPFYYKFAY